MTSNRSNTKLCEHHDSCTVSSRFEFERVKEEEVVEMLGSLDPNKAARLDSISCRILNMYAPTISRSLTSLFNFSLEPGQVASKWKMARVIPVPKGAALMEWKTSVQYQCCQW